MACLTIAASCRVRPYQVMARVPEYTLRSPNLHETPLKDVLREYNGFVRGRGSIDLLPQMQLRIENAYYQKGFSRKGLNGYLGTEIARYEVGDGGLRLLTVEPMKDRPEADAPVQNLISPAQLKFQFYRLYLEVLFNSKTGDHTSVLLAANTKAELDQLATQLADPETVCASGSSECTIFPEACSVSVEMRIVVNNKPIFITWGSLVSSVVNHHPPQRLEMQRLYRGCLVPVKLDPQNQTELSLPLLPGDHIKWH